MSKFTHGDIVKGSRHENKMVVHMVLEHLKGEVITRHFIGNKLKTELYNENELELIKPQLSKSIT